MTVLPPTPLPKTYQTRKPKFTLGQLAVTPGAMACLEQAGVSIFELLGRHASGDFGDLCQEDIKANQDAIIYGSRILSSYTVGDEKCYLITESDRSLSTLLLAREY